MYIFFPSGEQNANRISSETVSENVFSLFKPQENHQEKRERKQRFKLIPVTITVFKPEINNGYSVPFQAYETKVLIQGKGKGQVLREEAMKRKLKAILINFWTAVHPRPNRKPPVEVIIKRSRLKMHQSANTPLKKE